MVHKHIKSLPHHPKRVVTLSLIVALAVGIFGYLQINEKVAAPVIPESTQSNVTNLSSGNLTLGFLASGRIKSVSVKAGDTVTKGKVLAELDAGNTLGALTQARAAYTGAQANYQKVINGATGTTIDVAKAALNTAKTNLEQVTNQQNTLIINARRKLYSDGLVAVSDDDTRRNIVPTITGNYDGAQEGQYEIYFADFNALYNRNEISFRDLEKGIAEKSDLPQKFGTKGLLIAFPEADYRLDDRWTVDIPNKNGTNYVANLNAYQSAIQTKDQAIATAQATLDQANANLASIVTAARPEDVAGAQAQVNNALGAVQIAEAAYNNTIITAPIDGTVTSVVITAGQIAAPNAPAIELKANNF